MAQAITSDYRCPKRPKVNGSNYRCPERPKSTARIIIDAVAPVPVPVPVPPPILTSTFGMIGGFYDVKFEPPPFEPSPDRSQSATRTSPRPVYLSFLALSLRWGCIIESATKSV